MRRLSLVLLGVCALLVACSGGDDSGSGTPAPSSTTAPVNATTTAGSASPAGTVSPGATRTAAATGVPVTAAPTGPGQGPQAACRVVTTAEVAAATGLQMKDGMFTPGGLGGTCIYEQQRGQPSDLADRVYVQPFTSQTVYDELRAQVSGAQDVPGLGDRAYASPLEVAVMKGNRGVYISWDHVTITPGVTEAQRRDKLIALARAAAGRL